MKCLNNLAGLCRPATGSSEVRSRSHCHNWHNSNHHSNSDTCSATRANCCGVLNCIGQLRIIFLPYEFNEKIFPQLHAYFCFPDVCINSCLNDELFWIFSSITDWRGAESSSCWTSVSISTKNGHRKHCCQYSGRGTYKLCCHQQKNEWTRHSSFSHRATGGPHRWQLFYFFPFQITWVTEVTYCYCFGIRLASCVNIIFSRTTGPILINFGM